MPIPTRSVSLRGQQVSQMSHSAESQYCQLLTPYQDLYNWPNNYKQIDLDIYDPARDPNATTLSRRKTLAAPRNPSTPQDDGPTMGPRKQESRLPQRGSAQQESSTTRRANLVRPSPLKSVPSIRPATSSSTSKPPTTPTLASPRKVHDAVKQSSPKKTDMPPPPRPARSQSVRQPVGSTASSAPRGHMRHRSQLATPVTASPATKKVETPSSSAQRQKTQTQTSMYQRPSSPKKPIKPSVSTAAPSTATHPGADQSLIPSSWPEVATLQTELLQLSLLHSSAVQRNIDWQAESEAILREKYNSVAETYRSILGDENERQRKLNAQALNIWLKNSRERSNRQAFPEQVQLLSQIIQEVSNLSDNGGRYTTAIQEFEAWFTAVEEIKESRSRSGTESTADNIDLFIGPLNQDWKDEINALLMKLELSSRQLQSLDILGYGEFEQLQDSALLRTAVGLRDLMDMMIREIKTICAIEADIVRIERGWVSRIAEGCLETRPKTDSTPRVGIWRKGKS
ncbi:hypothetical protein PHISCL_09012 [Aspergillus sclerotialis]|uniref:Uncharacterized protein n=1 Tax=Aspergillus sclerotialis TaxID=2070753 RepID=A0A3A2Z6C6_9EURO|nr:hypothetical protein PHISCL_09012 [Aspergillus sclerotialis]